MRKTATDRGRVAKGFLLRVFELSDEVIKSDLEGRFYIGAGDGNRTHVISLEGWSSTIELHPHRMALSYTPLNKMSRKI